MIALVLYGAPDIAVSQVLEVTPTGDVIRHDGPEIVIAGTPAPQTITRRQDAGAMVQRHNNALAADAVAEAGSESGLSPALISAVAWQESHFNAAAKSPKGALGVMQLMPSTARMLRVDATDPRESLNGGARYLASLLRQFDGDLPLALAAYNAGPTAVMRYGRIPPYRETRNYVDAILDHLAGAVGQPVKSD